MPFFRLVTGAGKGSLGWQRWATLLVDSSWVTLGSPKEGQGCTKWETDVAWAKGRNQSEQPASQCHLVAQDESAMSTSWGWLGRPKSRNVLRFGGLADTVYQRPYEDFGLRPLFNLPLWRRPGYVPPHFIPATSPTDRPRLLQSDDAAPSVLTPWHGRTVDWITEVVISGLWTRVMFGYQVPAYWSRRTYPRVSNRNTSRTFI